MVAPYSGAMLAMVARVAAGSARVPSPKNSTNLPTTPVVRSRSVMVRTRSVAVTPSRSAPPSSTPTTSGSRKAAGWPSMAASASMPPTPHPTTPRPLTMVVCESVPTSESGYQSPSRSKAPRARCSRLTWWQMPKPGGTMRKVEKAWAPHLRNW